MRTGVSGADNALQVLVVGRFIDPFDEEIDFIAAGPLWPEWHEHCFPNDARLLGRSSSLLRAASAGGLFVSTCAGIVALLLQPRGPIYAEA
jgi:hypothetical protein